MSSSLEQYPMCRSTLIFGNPDADVCLTIVCNPYCGPCSKMHNRLQRFLETDRFKIQYQFVTFNEDIIEANKRLIAVYQKYGAEVGWNIFSQWFDLEEKTLSFFEGFGVDASSNEVIGESQRHAQWNVQSYISETPTPLVNGRKIPIDYSLEDVYKIFV